MAAPSRILVVEQDLLAALTIRHMLQGGHVDHAAITVDCRTSMDRAFDALQHATYSCILVDPELPDSHAQHTVASLHQYAPDIPIIVIAPDPQLKQPCLDNGASAFLPRDECTTAILHDCMQNVVGTMHSAGFKAEGQPA